METLDAILSRRSIRKYSSQPVQDEAVKEMLEAAMTAPSARNTQAWQFVVITDREMLDEIPKFHPYAAMLKQAPMAILVCGDERLEKRVPSLVQNCSAATQNILLAAHAIGLGAVWIGLYPKEKEMGEIRNLIGLPPHAIPISLISIGYPAEQLPPSNRYDESKVHRNTW